MLFFLSLLACGDEKSTDSAVSQSCPNDQDITISSTYPDLNDANHFYLRDTLEFHLSATDPSATISVVDSNGNGIDGSSVVNENIVSFTPTNPLEPSSSYTASLHYCGSTEPVAVPFSTSDLGMPLTTEMVDKTYAIHLASGNFVQPEGLGALFTTLFQNYMLLSITDADTELTFLGGLSKDDSFEQDFCFETMDTFPNAKFTEAPYFEIPVGDATLSAAGYSATIFNLYMTGTFASDGSYFGGGTFGGELDARELVDIINATGFSVDTADDICTLITSVNVNCAPCSSDNRPYCVTLEVNRLSAEETSLPLSPVCAVDCHESCETNLEECTEPQLLTETCAQ